MRVFGDSKADKELKGNYILLDNDFLSQLFRDKEVFEEFTVRFANAAFLIDSLTKFEFLRNIFIPQQRTIREKFISQSIFYPTNTSNQSIFSKLQENALLLSQIYSQNSKTNNSSFIDLILAGVTMYQSNTTVLITGNKKDFPSCIFDTVTVFNVEQEGDNSMRAYCIIRFNREKFNHCYEKLTNLGASDSIAIHMDNLEEDISPNDIPF